jgi:phosphoglycerate dehydrogenase-like enzyme
MTSPSIACSGPVGEVAVDILKPFAKIVVADITEKAASEQDATLVELDELLQKSDFVSIHALLNEKTRGLINGARLGLMKPGSFLINLARGAIIENLDVLYEALTDGRLAGAALDVFEPEPPDVSHPIFKLDHCLTSPHAICMSKRAMYTSFKMMAEDMAAVFQGGQPQFVANPEALG